MDNDNYNSEREFTNELEFTNEENIDHGLTDEEIDAYEAQYEERQQLCSKCRQREKDLSENKNSVLCKQCRDEHISLNVPLKIKLFLVAICAVFIISVCMFPSILMRYKVYVDAEKNMKSKEYVSAFYNYASLLEEYGDSIPIVLKASKAAMNAQYFGELTHIFDTYIVGKNLNDIQYNEAMSYSLFLDDYYFTLDEIGAISDNINNRAYESDDINLNRLFRNELELLLEKSNIDKAMVYYYIGSLAENVDDAIKNFKLSSEQDTRITYPLSYYGNVLRRAKKFDEAMQVYNQALFVNAEDASSIRGISIIELLEGNIDQSLVTMRRAYEIEPYGVYMPEAMIITLHENGLHEEADALLEKIVSEGFVAPADFQTYLDGNMTVQEYYMGDVQ